MCKFCTKPPRTLLSPPQDRLRARCGQVAWGNLAFAWMMGTPFNLFTPFNPFNLSPLTSHL